jgi:ATP-dependent RNA helicase RhlE
VLVATDIAARGIDIDQLPQVVNFELPNVPEDYVHRIGRTGRAGSTGSALSLVDSEEMGYLKDIEKLIKRNIVRVEVEGFVPTPRPAASPDERPARPPQNRQGQSRPQQGRGQGSREQQGRGQPSREARSQPAGSRQGQGAARPAKAQPAAAQQQRPAQPRKPKPQAALFSAKPGSRGH